MTPEQRDKLIDDYAWAIVDGMDIKDLCVMAAEQIAASMENDSDEEVIRVVEQFHPHLLEN